jgi:hypothetical protein
MSQKGIPAVQGNFGADLGYVHGAGEGTVALGSANLGIFTKFHIPHKITVAKVRVEVTVATAGSKVASIGIYDAETGLRVGTEASLDWTGTGVKEAAIAVVLHPGAYWLGISTDDTVTIRGQAYGGKLVGLTEHGTKASTYPVPAALPSSLTAVDGIPQFGLALA